MNTSLALEVALIQRKRQTRITSPTSSWERETGKGIHHLFGEYRLLLQTNNCLSEEMCEVVIEEDCSSIAARVWDCAVLTAKWLEHRATFFSGDVERSFVSQINLREALGLPSISGEETPQSVIQVLELGSGTGLLSICLAKMGAAVLATEYGAAVVRLRRNCDRNRVLRRDDSSTNNATTLSAGQVVCRDLDWYKTTETLQSLFPLEKDRAIFDVIVVTDCSLSPKESMGVLNMIERYGTPGHTRVLVGLCREREGTAFFVETAKMLYPHGVTTIPTSEYPTNYRTMRHTILLIQL
ncbi:lysine methyltransferase [Nitzschia inconspicua]|uniref:Lysine methyltransferase n=1 Tax=Nitzschia inconspicua TaxID=303405 RepID=A0A9K3KFJ4_9STRA|nr:lysine methyltransferase [Nitzschia inconspicua]KAG7342773.1 lysine methyltransferase [Nitzschia inconspicua]